MPAARGRIFADAIEPVTGNGWLKEQIGLWLSLGKLPGLRVGTIAPERLSPGS